MGIDWTHDVVRLTEACRGLFGDPSTWIEAEGYPDSLALCVIDSIFSTGSSYQSVINVVQAYRELRRAEGGNPDKDGISELLESFEHFGGSAAWAKAVNNHKPAHTKPGALLKAEVVRQAALVLNGLETGPILTAADLRAEYANDSSLKIVKKSWLRLPSQSSGVTYNYLLLLAGIQSVKPDRMVVRFINEQLQLDGGYLTPKQVAHLITQVAESYRTEPRKLDHVIWRHASNRPVFKA